jgi:hypothetical protein
MEILYGRCVTGALQSNFYISIIGNTTKTVREVE